MRSSSPCNQGNCCNLGTLSLSLLVALSLGLVVALSLTSRAEDHGSIDRDAPGIAEEKPADLPENAQVVPIESGGYMVPYEANIPGSELTYKMTPIPGGTFTMGSPEDEADRGEDEGPQFEVEVDPFWMGTTHVTWAQYRRFMDMYDVFKDLQEERPITDANRGDAITIPTPLYDPATTFELGDDDEHPAVTMTQYAARQYSKWLSKLTGRFYRLPTEAEWEYAARAGTTTAWSFGDDIDELDDYSWNFSNAGDVYHHVGTKKPNPWGLYDMHGNVAHLVIDEYAEDHYSNFADADGPVHWMDAINWPTSGDGIVVRGGSWDHDPEWTRSAYRYQTNDENWKMSDPNLPKSPWWFTEFDGQATGFRLVRPLHEPDDATKRKFWGDLEFMPEDVQFDVDDRLGEGRGTLGPVNQDLIDHLNAE